MTFFRPCIDLHEGSVKQIVGGTLSESSVKENFVSDKPAAYFAELYAHDRLKGGHVIQLGPGNEAAAVAALKAYPGGLQLGGGVNPHNARTWLDAGASQVIVTSFLFEDNRFSEARLQQMLEVVSPHELVVDLSCRKTQEGWAVATNRWQTVTDTLIEPTLLEGLASQCSELLIHAADVEGLCKGIDQQLVRYLGKIAPLPCTYAGGARRISDLSTVQELSEGKVDLTFGSALDVFGGDLVKYAECVAWNQHQKK